MRFFEKKPDKISHFPASLSFRFLICSLSAIPFSKSKFSAASLIIESLGRNWDEGDLSRTILARDFHTNFFARSHDSRIKKGDLRPDFRLRQFLQYQPGSRI